MTHPTGPDDPAAHPGVNWGQLLVVILLVLAAGLIGVTLPYARNASKNSDALDRTAEISGCRSVASAAVTDARTAVDSFAVENDVLESRFEDALLNNDRAALRDLASLYAPLRARTIAAQRELEARNRHFKTIVQLSVDDPDEFLDRCRNGAITTTTTATTAPPDTTVTTGTAEAAPYTPPPRRKAPRPPATTVPPAPPATARPRPTTTTTASPCDQLLAPLSIPVDLPC